MFDKQCWSVSPGGSGGGGGGGDNEHCLSSFDAKESRSEAGRSFDCHILGPIKQLKNSLFKGTT